MTQPLPATQQRIKSLDLLRGLIMIIMALDHVRDYLHVESLYFDPLDLEKTTAPIFLTRWITHYCAPIFMLLAGTSAFLVGQKKTKKELSIFLLTRGMWLVFLEMVVINFAWSFNIHFPMILFTTMWALGISMIALAALIYLPKKILLAFCILMIAGHNLLDNIHVTSNLPGAFGWAILHEQNYFPWNGKTLIVGYPIIPWIAVMALGYCIGNWYSPAFKSEKRKKNLLILGGSCIVLFLLLRVSNIYGDTEKWSVQKSALVTFLSILKVTKYPPSLLYLLITLGPAFIFLALTENIKAKIADIISVYGRVPLFYYVIHIYLIHIVALMASAFTPGQDWRLWILDEPIWDTTAVRGYGFSLLITYLFWIAIVIAVYPFCKKYDTYKQANKQKWWLSYL